MCGGGEAGGSLVFVCVFLMYKVVFANTAFACPVRKNALGFGVVLTRVPEMPIQQLVLMFMATLVALILFKVMH